MNRKNFLRMIGLGAIAAPLASKAIPVRYFNSSKPPDAYAPAVAKAAQEIENWCLIPLEKMEQFQRALAYARVSYDILNEHLEEEYPAWNAASARLKDMRKEDTAFIHKMDDELSALVIKKSNDDYDRSRA